MNNGDFLLNPALLKFIGQYLENEIRYQQALSNFWWAWSNNDPQKIW